MEITVNVTGLDNLAKCYLVTWSRPQETAKEETQVDATKVTPDKCSRQSHQRKQPHKQLQLYRAHHQYRMYRMYSQYQQHRPHKRHLWHLQLVQCQQLQQPLHIRWNS